jgi:serine/threonine-protein kinase
MAQVWTARPEGGGLARTVAIKLVRPEYAADEEYSRMFIDEAMVASSIHHPNVCEIFELGRDDDLLFMVLEWVAGDSLSGLVQRGADLQPLPDQVAARICADACAGLHAAHEALGPDGQPLGIVHRDVSPPNILVSMHGHVKVSDFGIAKARHQLHSRTRTGEIKGKFAYIPPEQILGRGVDRRADVYAMGCVLYVASLGLRPFGGGATALGKIVQGKYRLPTELRPDYPPQLEQIVVRALAADPTQRYQTADEMRIALEQWMLGSSPVVVPGDVARIVRDRMNPERRRLVEAVMSSSRTLPEALAYQLLSVTDKTDTPTATSGLVMQPPGLGGGSGKKKKKTPSIDPEATLIGQPEPSGSNTNPAPPPVASEPPAQAEKSVAPRKPSSTIPAAPSALTTVAARLSSIPPKFRSGMSFVGVWLLALAALLAIMGYLLDRH